MVKGDGVVYIPLTIDIDSRAFNKQICKISMFHSQNQRLVLTKMLSLITGKPP
jgi:hypothetical protein